MFLLGKSKSINLPYFLGKKTPRHLNADVSTSPASAAAPRARLLDCRHLPLRRRAASLHLLPACVVLSGGPWGKKAKNRSDVQVIQPSTNGDFGLSSHFNHDLQSEFAKIEVQLRQTKAEITEDAPIFSGGIQKKRGKFHHQPPSSNRFL